MREILKRRYGAEISTFSSEPENTSLDDENTSEEITDDNDDEDLGIIINPRHKVNMKGRNFMLKEKFLSWSATSSATEEIIEYVEELVQLTKMIVGVNEFKYGFLSRPLYEDWAAEAVTGFAEFVKETQHSNNGHSTGMNTLENIEQPDTLYNSLDEEVMESSSEINQEMPVALENDEHISRTLARMATNASNISNKNGSSKWRHRAYSIGSGIGNDDIDILTKTKTLGDANRSFYDDSSSSDDELPLVLKRIVSHKK